MDEDDKSFLYSKSEESEERRVEANYSAIPLTNKYTQHTLIGDVRNFKRFTWVEWVFIAVGLVAFLFSVSLTIERFVHFDTNFDGSSESFQEICHPQNSTTNCIVACTHWRCLSDVTFAIALLVNLFFCLFYGVDGLLRERGFELLGVLVAIIIILLYLTTNFIYHMVLIYIKGSEPKFHGGELAVRIIRLAISWILGPILAAFALFVYIRMGKLWFTLIGGNRELKRAFQCSSFLAALLLFNIQIIVNLLILGYTRDGTFLCESEKIILPILAAYVIVLSPVGWIGIWYEVYSLTIVFLVFLLPTPAYYIYKIVNVAQNYPLYNEHPGRDTSHDPDGSHFEYIAIVLFIVNFLGLLVFVLIYIFAVLVMRNFKKGLKEKIEPPFSMLVRKFSGSTVND